MNLWLRLVWFFLFGRFRPQCSIFEVCSTPFIVIPTDLDVLLHVNNGRYLSILDIARLDFMSRSGMLAKFNKQGWYPVVSAETIYFKRALKVFQRFKVESRVLGWDEKYFYLQQRFVRKDELIAQAIIQAQFRKKMGGPVSPAEIIALDNPPKDFSAIPEWVINWSKSQKT